LAFVAPSREVEDWHPGYETEDHERHQIDEPELVAGGPVGRRDMIAAIRCFAPDQCRRPIWLTLWWRLNGVLAPTGNIERRRDLAIVGVIA